MSFRDHNSCQIGTLLRRLSAYCQNGIGVEVASRYCRLVELGHPFINLDVSKDYTNFQNLARMLLIGQAKHRANDLQAHVQIGLRVCPGVGRSRAILSKKKGYTHGH